jgi:hypothetical protein
MTTPMPPKTRCRMGFLSTAPAVGWSGALALGSCARTKKPTLDNACYVNTPRRMRPGDQREAGSPGGYSLEGTPGGGSGQRPTRRPDREGRAAEAL